jgi:hypothetical protein
MIEVMMLAVVFVVGLGSVVAAGLVLGYRALNKSSNTAND